ncbi:MAG: M1 family metallopeptidase [Chloroflexota bacterium]|nr:M1 family metallopeptidase [Chloroflexota bacterium]
MRFLDRDRSPRSTRWRVCGVIPLLVALLNIPLSVMGAAPASVPELYAPVLPEERAAVIAATDGQIDAYTLRVRLDPATSAIGGELAVSFTNQTVRPLTEVYFRLYPNAAYYAEGSLTIEAATVAGERVEPELQVGDTALRLPLGRVLPPGAAIALELVFSTVVPLDSGGSFGILNHASVEGTWVLADWYPIIAGYEQDTGWFLGAPTGLGDPTFAATALYDVSITAPGGLTVVASGSATGETTVEPDGALTQRYLTGPARDFALIADEDFIATSVVVDGTTVTAYALPGGEVAAQLALSTAVEALTHYNLWFGAYPFAELDLAQSPLTGALGLSWSGLIYLDANRYRGDPAAMSVVERDLLEFIVAHEVGHQWWGGSVGSNSNDHTFLVESLTNYLSVAFVEEVRGAARGGAARDAMLVGPYLSLLGQGIDDVVDTPAAPDQESATRTTIVYSKGGLGFLAIRRAVGDDAFFTALASYAETHAFGVTDPDDLQGAFETASGSDLDELWRVWFESAETTPDDVAALL